MRLKDSDAKEQLRKAQDLSVSIVKNRNFWCFMNYAMSLKPRDKNLHYWPQDSLKWDSKIWSHQKGFSTNFMPSDATNMVYWHAIALLMATCQKVPSSWEKLLAFQEELRWISVFKENKRKE